MTTTTMTGRRPAAPDTVQAAYLNYLLTRLRAEVRLAERAVARYADRDQQIRDKYQDRITVRLRKQEDTGLADEGAALGFHAQMVAVYSAALCGEAAYVQLCGGRP